MLAATCAQTWPGQGILSSPSAWESLGPIWLKWLHGRARGPHGRVGLGLPLLLPVLRRGGKSFPGIPLIFNVCSPEVYPIFNESIKLSTLCYNFLGKNHFCAKPPQACNRNECRGSYLFFLIWSVVTALPDKYWSQATQDSEQDIFPVSADLEPVLDQEQGWGFSYNGTRSKCSHRVFLHNLLFSQSLCLNFCETLKGKAGDVSNNFMYCKENKTEQI